MGTKKYGVKTWVKTTVIVLVMGVISGWLCVGLDNLYQNRINQIQQQNNN